jgi:hypothetical protein
MEMILWSSADDRVSIGFWLISSHILSRPVPRLGGATNPSAGQPARSAIICYITRNAFGHRQVPSARCE